MAYSRWALVLSCIIGLSLALAVYSTSPAVVPVHFGPSGVPDRWGSPLEVLVVQGCVIGLTTLLFGALPQVIRHGPSTLINLPNKEYWLAPERREVAAVTFARWANVLGTAVNVLMIALQVLLAPDAEGAVTPAYSPSILLGAFLAFTALSCVWLARSYRLPERP